MKTMPLVSIVIPVYNGTDYMRKAIDSALAQSYGNTEVLVINDGSTDNTEAIALSYGDRIRYFRKENGGVSSALNFGIKNMKGEYFSWLSHDDEYEPDKILHQIETLSACSPDTICVCGSRLINADSEPLDKGSSRPKRALQESSDWSLMLKRLLKTRTINGCSLLIPKEVFDRCGYFDESLRFIQDFSMWINICLHKYPWIYNDHVDVLSRVHGNQVTQTRRDLYYSESSRLSKSLIPQLLEISDKKHNYLYLYAKMSAKANCKDVAQASIKAAASKKLFGPWQLLCLKMVGKYGKIRPWIRKMYYKYVRHVKTQ